MGLARVRVLTGRSQANDDDTNARDDVRENVSDAPVIDTSVPGMHIVELMLLTAPKLIFLFFFSNLTSKDLKILRCKIDKAQRAPRTSDAVRTYPPLLACAALRPRCILCQWTRLAAAPSSSPTPHSHFPTTQPSLPLSFIVLKNE